MPPQELPSQVGPPGPDPSDSTFSFFPASWTMEYAGNAWVVARLA
jgi:hypothetical protein